MITFKQHSVFTEIDCSDKELYSKVSDLLRDKLSFTTTEYVRKGRWSSYQTINHTLWDNGIFPAGLLERACYILKSAGIEYIIEEPPLLEGDYPLEFKGELRPYQAEDLIKVTKRRHGIVHIPPGGGKTVLVTAITAQLGLQPTLIFVHTKDLQVQMTDSIKKFLGVKPGEIGGGEVKIKPITVSTVQTFADKLNKKDKKIVEYAKKVKMVVADECHHLAAKEFYQVMSSLTNTERRYSFSATPWRDDGYTMLIEAATGPIIAKRTTAELVAQGHLVPAKVYVVPVNDLNSYNATNQKIDYKKAKRASRDYQKIYKEHIVDNDLRNTLITELAEHCITKDLTPTLILVRYIEHGKKLFDTLHQKFGDEIAFLTGKDKIEVRTEVLNKIRNNKLKIIIMTPLADEGVDLPSLRCAIIASAGKSSIKAFQRVGRILRPYENKKEAIIFDFWDYAPILSNHSKTRVNLYKSEYNVKEMTQEDITKFLNREK